LGAQNKIALPTTEVDEIYRYSTIYEFLRSTPR